MSVAAKWVDCSRCACTFVLVLADFEGDVLCDQCCAERGTLQTSPLTVTDATARRAIDIDCSSLASDRADC